MFANIRLRRVAIASTLSLFVTASAIGAEGSKQFTGSGKKTPDLRYAEAFRLSPAEKRLKVGGAALFQVEWCEPIEGPRDAQGMRPRLGEKCGPLALDLAGLLLSDWSVNGVPGGNKTYGTVYANVDRGGYEAPKTLPDGSVVALSVNVRSLREPNLKSTLVANITLVDGETYFGFVKFKGKRDEQGVTTDYSGRADLEFRRVEIFEGGVRYELGSNPIWTAVEFDQWSVRDDSVRCELVENAKQRDPAAPFTGTLFTYSALQSYVVSALLQVKGRMKCKDGETTYIEEVSPTVLLTTSKGSTDPGYQKLGDGKKLSGASVLKMQGDEGDAVVNQSISWTLVKD